ncbi:hypothetical protein PENTCL1PPCAC_11383 [Pristionchus entomophagus]|uniref:G protein-coupled receptor n=1 Tax=Pristionchus entomophagus TaxID=358040 RepID=A0AAV5T1M3_9BILA|nr:hypothetical protein PENTCL1PPCAC_11383 [Pristionchus entomophagus]
MCLVQFIFPYDLILLYRILCMTNTTSSTGSTIGKFYILIQRYFILKGLSFDEQKWSGRTMRRLIAIQIFFPLLISLIYGLGDYKTKMKDGILILNGASDSTTVAIKVVNNIIYATFIIYGFIFIFLYRRSFKRMKRHAEAGTLSNLVNKQRVMVIFVLGCTITHLIKALHQIVWTIAAAMGNQTFIEAVYPLYPYANGLANFASPIILFLCFRRVRWLLVEGCISPTRKGSTVHSNRTISHSSSDTIEISRF